MKTLSFPALFAILATTCVLAIFVTFQMVRKDVAEAHALESSARPMPADLALPDAVGELKQRLEELEFENRALTHRIEELEARPAPATRAPVGGYVTRHEFDSLAARLLQPAAEPLFVTPEEELFEEQVASALGEIRKRERIDAVEKYHEQRAARVDSDVEKISEWLELDGAQEEGVRLALLAQYDRETELTRQWKAGETDDEVLGEIKLADREDFRADLSEVLTVEQLDTFWTRVVEQSK